MADKILAFCCSKRTGNMLAVSIIAIFVIFSFTRNYDFKTFESIVNDIGNDWGTYARYGLDIKNNGVLIPSIPSAYSGPAGFLYNYFIALCLLAFGEKSFPIYVIQHLMLGLSVAFVYWTFRDKMRSLTALVFLWTLFFFALKDVYKNYTPLLLSENLALFTISAFFFCFVKGFEKDNFLLQCTAAALLGLSVLTRPNIFIYAIVLIPLVASYYIKKSKGAFAHIAVFLTVLILSSSFIFLRNYALLKQFHFFPTNMSSLESLKHFHPIPPSVDLSRTAANVFYAKLHFDRVLVDYIEYVMQQPYLFFGFYFKKALFCLGYLPILLKGSYAPRLRWIIMWFGYFAYIFFHIKDREKWKMWEAAVHLFILCYYGTLIMTTYVHNYGFRMLIPAIFFVLPFAFMAADRVLPAPTKA